MDEQKQLLNVDYKNEDDIKQILPATPSHNSHQLGWNNIDIQYHEQPAGEMPANSTNQHLISVHLQSVSGTQERCLDGKKWVGPLENGQISLIPANSFHAANWTNLAKVSILILEPEYLVQLAHESVEVERVELLPTINITDPIIYNIASLLLLESQSNKAQSLLYVGGLSTALSAHLLRNYCTIPQKLRKFEDGLSKVKLQLAIDFIQSHLSETVSLEEIATELEISSYYFCRLFKLSTGISPYQYLIQCRIERAKELLLQRQMRSAQVAFEVGFSDQSHFIRHFKKIVGVTPKQFLTEHFYKSQDRSIF
jgi:AraC family transcriptional regulator